ncbi:hypothetical protein JOD55_000376 [Arcanobacterium pluranimalium]|uniref:SHOCT domain-containing protein n=1 Tax=Arcanobacterium pluranimalium TaxID=108028 RepID=UPI0019571F90|nr:SHOCT domain-containing protein [Arcanobacterium pluranimalium]MBM7824549.1 hypothetical protein [Arcanobacterium pluranimalium]
MTAIMGFMDKVKQEMQQTAQGMKRGAEQSWNDAKATAKHAMTSINEERKEVAFEDTETDIPLRVFESHIEGAKNAKVRVFEDRIEWRRNRGISMVKLAAGLTTGVSLLVTGIRGGDDGYEIVWMRDITAISSHKDGLVYRAVKVSTSGGDVTFRISRSEAEEVREMLLSLVQKARQQPAPQIVSPQVPPTNSGDDTLEKLRKLAELKDLGILTDEEFNAKKATLLSQI